MAEKVNSYTLSLTGWTLVAEDCDYAQVQLGGNSDSILIQVATSLPDPSVTNGIRLAGDNAIWPSPPLTNGTDIVYARAIGRACTVEALAV